MKRAVLLVMLLMCFVAAALAADDRRGHVLSDFNRANLAYRDGQYAEAVKLYEQIIAGGHDSGPVYYNLANSYYKSGQVGRAVLNLERALQMMPRDADLLYNRKFITSRITVAGELSWWQRISAAHADFYSMDEMILIIVGLITFLAVLHLASLYANWPRKLQARVLSGVFVVLLVFVVGLVVKWDRQRDRGVVVDAASARFEPHDKATVYFELVPGQTVTLLEQQDAWRKIKRPDGKLGWVQGAAVEKI